MADGLALIHDKPRSLVCREILRVLFDSPEPMTLEGILLMVGTAPSYRLQIHALIQDLRFSGDVIHESHHDSVRLKIDWRYHLSAATWLRLAREQQGEPE